MISQKFGKKDGRPPFKPAPQPGPSAGSAKTASRVVAGPFKPTPQPESATPPVGPRQKVVKPSPALAGAGNPLKPLAMAKMPKGKGRK